MQACTVLLISLALLAGCGSDAAAPPVVDPPYTGSGHLSVEVAPLNLGAEVGDAIFAVTVYDADGKRVWHVDRISTKDYGANNGFTYVGPCDAAGRDYRVELVLLELRDTMGNVIPPTSYHNPTSPEHPLVESVPCEHSAVFDMDLALDEDEGFFDVGVKFDEVFCSAKVDCRDGQGDPLKLLFPPGGSARAETAIFGLACTSSHGATWLYLDQLVVTCANDLAVLNPSGPEGNSGPKGHSLYQTAVYVGSQVSDDDQVCYWNAALGIKVGDDAKSCRLTTRATAARQSWPGNHTPDGVIYPYIDVAVQLTDGAGNLVCGNQPIADGGPVTIEYTDGHDTVAFDNARACGFQTVPFPRDIECDGALGGTDVVFTDRGSGLFTVKFGDDELATPMTLPLGNALQSCCGNPCCSD